MSAPPALDAEATGLSHHMEGAAPGRFGSRFWVLVEAEIRAALRGRWTVFALALGAVWGIASIIEFQQLRENTGPIHNGEGLLALIDQLLWAALLVAATVGGPSLLDDQRTGALELYFSRTVRRSEYLGAKIASLLALTAGTVFLPAVAYWASAFVFYEGHPDWWNWGIPGALVVALLWGTLVTGLALGLSAVLRSGGAVALLLLGGFATLDYLVDPPQLLQRVATITSLTEDARAAVLSPFTWAEVQKAWIMRLPDPPPYPHTWGLGAWFVASALGWALVAFKSPRPRGVEDA